MISSQMAKPFLKLADGHAFDNDKGQLHMSIDSEH
jgi:hypothetical protein